MFRRSLLPVVRPHPADTPGLVYDEGTEVVVAGVFRSALPEAERLSAEQLISDLQARGLRARHIEAVDEIIATIVAEHRPGDVVVLMSNGGFGGIHRRLLQALAA